MSVRGTVLSIHIAPAGRAPIVSLGEIQAIAGKGLEEIVTFARPAATARLRAPAAK